jgi:Ca-activated chloride channel homolog
MGASAAAVLESIGGAPAVLEEVRAEVSINDLLAEVEVVQRYRNPEDTTIEAVYTFPLPLDAVLLGFEIEIGDQELKGIVVEKPEAADRYEDAITDGDAAVLLEQSRLGLYTASVGNLLPGETASIRFRYGHLLRWNGDSVRFQMPTTIAPRYGDPAAAALAPHQYPEYAFDAERRFHLRVTVRGLLKDARFQSPSHAVSVASTPEVAIIDLSGNPVMDRDFVLEAQASVSGSCSALVAPDLDGWVAQASFCPEIQGSGQHERRSIKILVDCSGSMSGDSIAQAREALNRILDSLHEDDLFDVLAFGNDCRALFDKETPVSETAISQAKQFVRTLDADMGGTEIGQALKAAYRIGSAGGLPRDLLIITDGEVWDQDDVISSAKSSGHRIFTVGVGSAVAEGLVRGLADVTGGACELVAPSEDMATRIHRHFQRMYAPRADNVSIRWPEGVLRSQPKNVRTIFGGDTLHVFAWFKEKPAGVVSLDVTLSDGHTVTNEAEVPPDPASNEASPCTLARLGAANTLLDTDNEQEATQVAVDYQLMSQWTNYIVVHVRAEDDRAAEPPQIRKVPQVLAAGWQGMGSVVMENRQESFDNTACAYMSLEDSDHEPQSISDMEYRGPIPPSPGSEKEPPEIDEILKKELQEIEEVLASIAAAILQEPNRVASTMVAVAASKIAAAGVLAGTFSAIGAFGAASTGTAIATLSGAAAISASTYWVGSAFGMGAVAGAYIMTGGALAVGIPAAFFARRKLIGRARSEDDLTDRERANLFATLRLASALRFTRLGGKGPTRLELAIVADRGLVPLIADLRETFLEIELEQDKCVSQKKSLAWWPKRRLRSLVTNLELLARMHSARLED